MSLSLLQTEEIHKTWTSFTKSLTDEQKTQLYFRLDDLLQYGHNSLRIAYRAVDKVRNSGR